MQIWEILIAPEVSFSLKCSKITTSGWGSALDPAGGVYNAPSNP